MECGLDNILVPKKVFLFQSKRPKKIIICRPIQKKFSVLSKYSPFSKIQLQTYCLIFCIVFLHPYFKKTFPRERSRIAFPSLPHHHLKRRVENHRHICHPLFLRYFRAIPNHAEGLRVHPFFVDFETVIMSRVHKLTPLSSQSRVS